MLIQPSVQSASYGATFASSVSPTGVEQTVSRAPLPPVEETSRDSASQNRSSPFQTPNPASQSAPQPAAAQAPGPAPASATPNKAAEEPAPQQNSRDIESARQQLQEEADQALLAQLKARDREVRLHEAAHAAVGGRYAGSPSFQYRRGPDGNNYAVGGEVSISTGPVAGDPQATIEKARVIRAAALAPAEPSSQDRRVAAEAAQLELSARAELREVEAAARDEEQKTREAAQAEKQAEEAKRKQQEESAATETEEDTTESAATRPDPATARAGNERDADADEETADESDEPPRPNARERLEQILLSSGSILQQANRQGLVNPQNPYGKSGFLDVIA